MLLSCGAGEDSWESFGQQGDQTSCPKGNQPWILIGRTGAEAEAPILWPPEAKSWLVEKTLMLGKMEGRRRKGWQRTRWLDGITIGWAWVWASSRTWWRAGKPGILQSMSYKESSMTEWPNNSNNNNSNKCDISIKKKFKTSYDFSV